MREMNTFERELFFLAAEKVLEKYPHYDIIDADKFRFRVQQVYDALHYALHKIK